jgi:hypothetical protein
MKVLVVGATYGKIDLFNKYVEESECDLILSTGNIGICTQTEDRHLSGKYGKGNFGKYLDGEKKFIKPIIAVPGAIENYDLVKGIQDGDIVIDNFKLLKQGEKYNYFLTENDGIGVTGLGGVFSPTSYPKNEKPNNHYNYEDMFKVRQNYETNVLLMHEMCGPYIKPEIKFTPDMLALMNETLAFYAFFGRYETWFSRTYNKTNRGKMVLCSLPKLQNSYGVLNTRGWNLNGVNIIEEEREENE